MTRPALIPKFYSYRYPDATPRYDVAWVANACTRSVNVEFGRRQFQAVWTRKAYRR